MSLWKFRAAIKQALAEYVESNDHEHSGIYPGDCVACGVRKALGVDDEEIYRLAVNETKASQKARDTRMAQR